MWYAAAVLIFTGIPPNMFTDYNTHFLPTGWPQQIDCTNYVAVKNAEPPSSALAAGTKQYWFCVQI